MKSQLNLGYLHFTVLDFWTNDVTVIFYFFYLGGQTWRKDLESLTESQEKKKSRNNSFETK